MFLVKKRERSMVDTVVMRVMDRRLRKENERRRLKGLLVFASIILSDSSMASGQNQLRSPQSRGFITIIGDDINPRKRGLPLRIRL
jgi:hypothetical protein